MAKILLENRFILTKKLHAEYCRETNRKMRKKTKVMCFLLAAVSFIAAVLFAIFLKSSKLVTVALVLVVYFILTGLYGYKLSEIIDYKSMLREHGKAIVMILEFTPVQVLVKVNKTSFAFKYSTIKRIIETDNLYILILGGKGMIEHGQVLYKNGFKGGDENSFKKLMQEKVSPDIL